MSKKKTGVVKDNLSMFWQVKQYNDKIKIFTLLEQFQSSIAKLQKRKIDTPNTQIHCRSQSWLDTSTSIRSGGITLVLWAHRSVITTLNMLYRVIKCIGRYMNNNEGRSVIFLRSSSLCYFNNVVFKFVPLCESWYFTYMWNKLV